jgi:hypothetical protein
MIYGWTLLPERLPADLVAAMQARFLELLAAKERGEPTNRGRNRYQMFLPWEPPFNDPRLYEHPQVLAVVEELLGPDASLAYFASDTPLPGSDYQPVHADTRLLFPELDLPVPPYALALNVPLVDCTEENGSLEFWPGTHLARRPSELDEAAGLLESRRANMPAGSLLVRDLRMWHRGTPNRSAAPRPHLALVYARPWYRFELAGPLLRPDDWEALSERGRRLLVHARPG